VIYTQTEYFLPGIKEQVLMIKAVTNVPIVVGGAGYSIFPKEILKELEVQFGIVGEGEISLHRLCLALQGQGEIKEISGLVYQEGGQILINPLCALTSEELGILPYPDFNAIDASLYYQDGGTCSIQTKRGCALNCVYCTYPIVEGQAFRLRPASSVVAEMRQIIEKHHMNYFYFVDSIFNVPFQHAEEICDEIIKQELNLKWFGYLSPKGFTQERLEKLVRSGVDGIWFSVDTCSERMLKNMGKGFTQSDIINAVNLCKTAGIRYNFVLLLGGPGETEETLHETFEFLERYDPNLAVILYGLRIYPKTGLAETAFNEGVISEKDELLEPEFYLAPKIKENLVDIIKDRCQGHLNWNFTSDKWDRRVKLHNIMMERKVQDLYKKGARGPFWAVVDKMINNEL
jgi:radical SAM superfamily enzyme YgiQ (UPF0313 family)